MNPGPSHPVSADPPSTCFRPSYPVVPCHSGTDPVTHPCQGSLREPLFLGRRPGSRTVSCLSSPVRPPPPLDRSVFRDTCGLRRRTLTGFGTPIPDPSGSGTPHPTPPPGIGFDPFPSRKSLGGSLSSSLLRKLRKGSRGDGPRGGRVVWHPPEVGCRSD